MTLETSAVPVLDLSLDIEEIAETCRKACEEHGFLFIANHGIPEDLITAHAEAQRQFFALPLEDKCSILADENNRGYTPILDETLDPAHSTQGDAKEGLYYGREIPTNSPEAQLPLHGPNQWPDQSLLPNYRETTETYMAAVEDLGFRMLPIIARSLGLPPDAFLPYFQKPMTFLRPLHYTAVPSNESEGRHAAGAHSDYGFLTLLWTDGTPGLQIFYKGKWENVKAPEGAFIVNLGDMLERWTAGRFASTLHRVTNPLGLDRHSCAFFFEPSFDAEVAPLPGCGDDEESIGKYPVITSGNYLLSKYASTHEGYRQKMESGGAKT